MPLRLEDYALVGDCHTAALVGADGSIDWLCLPRFDSGACFTALLGTPEHGRWLLAPKQTPRNVRRKYRDGTLVLETRFETDDGVVNVVDFMPPRGEAPDIVRIVVGEKGRVPMHTWLTLRCDYGSVTPWVRRLKDGHGIHAVAGPDSIYVSSKVPLRGKGLHTVGEFTIGEGESVSFTLTWKSTYESPPKLHNALSQLRLTERWWKKWSDRCTYRGRWRDAVVRSLITLKALTYAPTGGIVAAATTSLPEALGGGRNWDYRYCWLRDATFSLYALTIGGYTEEAKAWRQWLVNSVAGNPQNLQIMYGLAGERRLTELELPWLEGYENSAPVRIGNAAYQQRQLDVYGELLDSLYSSRRLGLKRSEEAWRIQRGIVNYLLSSWDHPDKGIWEVRGPERPFTYSKIMAWAAFDRAVKMVEEFGEQAKEVDRWRRARDDVRAEVLAGGYSSKLKAFTQYYGSRDADASLLLMPMVGFIDARDPRMKGTVKLIEKQLLRNGLIRRYPPRPSIDGQEAGEGAFLICTFWLADNYAMQGRRKQAVELFEQLLSLRNEVGLLSEEYDPARKRLVGNFPQAFSHVGLVNTARNLGRTGGPAQHRGGRRSRHSASR